MAGKYKRRRSGDEQPNENDEHEKATSCTTLHDLPLEMLDIILQMSYLHWMLNSPVKLRDEEVIRSLGSVDVCFNRRIIRQRFKKAIWLYLKDFYGRTMKGSAIIRNNRNYFLNNIQWNDGLISTLLSRNCVTEEQSHFIQRQSSNRDKNAELLNIIRSFDETKLSSVIKCFRQTNQMEVGRIVTNGGVVIKVKIRNCCAAYAESVNTQLRHHEMSYLLNRNYPESTHSADELISQLNEEGIEILNSQMDRRTVVVWIWCRSKAALEYVKKMYESKQLRDVLFSIEHTCIQSYISTVISIDRKQFKKNVVIRSISINFTQEIGIRNRSTDYSSGVRLSEEVDRSVSYGITKLRNEIYVLWRSGNVISVYEDRYPFRSKKNIEMKYIQCPFGIGSSDKDRCLYVSDSYKSCIWKITREIDDQHKTIKWLTTDYTPDVQSVSSDGHVLMIKDSSRSLMIYGSDAELIRSIQLPTEIEDPLHAVETSIGNFIILHLTVFNKKKPIRDLTDGDLVYFVSELSRDGQTVIRCFIPSDRTQKLNSPRHLSLDSDDRVFVADFHNCRVILLDSDLKWNQILRPSSSTTITTTTRTIHYRKTPLTNEEKTRLWPYDQWKYSRSWPLSLCYDEENKQLIAEDCSQVYVYTLSRN